MELNRLNSIITAKDYGDIKLDKSKEKESFSSFLKNALNQVNEMQIESDEYKKMLAVGDVDNLHDVMIASDKANTAMQVTLSIRNKVVEAYKEIMRIQI
ncbi:flagellar hook-basal body complex protein FliE [Tissierella sp. MSJ-40]|uniref:Flagellar hook-basal body complex protein FliE n=1 Tax=Tissierella simiarum TaxID=2841534 RepID=A0ABS6E474_9FIRM|nr:flagellar hook-basal body complex protein FliE [Tissierella simiarum]MBU5437713.1 flagellar hook-basal body complex protein FliE [Tissierella simiarum]